VPQNVHPRRTRHGYHQRRRTEDTPSTLWIRNSDKIVCNALGVGLEDQIPIVPFDPAFQDAFRLLVLDGMAERWGTVDASLNPDLDDIETSYDGDGVPVALDGALVVGTGVLMLRSPERQVYEWQCGETIGAAASRRDCCPG
jgi:hypothetical protein